jgi:hypothetical protein
MEEQADGWLTVLEKNGLGPTAGILENYGIDSETDLLVLDQDDFIKLASRGLEGDSFEFITAFDTLSSMGQHLKSCMSSLVLGELLAPVVDENGGKNDLSMWGHVTQGRVSQHD